MAMCLLGKISLTILSRSLQNKKLHDITKFFQDRQHFSGYRLAVLHNQT